MDLDGCDKDSLIQSLFIEKGHIFFKKHYEVQIFEGQNVLYRYLRPHANVKSFYLRIPKGLH